MKNYKLMVSISWIYMDWQGCCLNKMNRKYEYVVVGKCKKNVVFRQKLDNMSKV